MVLERKDTENNPIGLKCAKLQRNGVMSYVLNVTFKTYTDVRSKKERGDQSSLGEKTAESSVMR